MEFAFPWPMTQGQWPAWISAAITVLLGVFFLFAPRLALRFLKVQPIPDRPEAVVVGRADIAGFYLGVGLTCILSGQWYFYQVLGYCWLITAFGRIVSMLSDRGNTLQNWSLLLVNLALAAPALALGWELVE